MMNEIKKNTAMVLCPNCKNFHICKFREINVIIERKFQEVLDECNKEGTPGYGNWGHTCQFFYRVEKPIS